MSDNTGNNLLLLLAGLVVGVGVGVLIAPDKGSVTRQKIKDGFDSSADDVLEKLAGLIDGVKKGAEDLIPGLKEVLEASNPEEKNEREELIELLEQKLEALKANK